MEAVSRGQSPRFYVAQLDGLRFLAFMAVFVTHAGRLPSIPPVAVRVKERFTYVRTGPRSDVT